MAQPIDIERVRAETPACARLIHFNNAGAALSPVPVLDAVRRHLALESEIGGYEAHAAAKDALDGFYRNFAALLNAAPEEIAFVENATRAWDMGFYALPLAEGDRIITHASEYASNYLAFLQLKRRRGVEIDVADSDASGQIDVDSVRRLIGPRTRLIAITHVPSHGGLVNPAEEIGKTAREFGLWFLLDACQSVGQRVVDVQRIGCHLLSGTGRKFLRGPRGTGFLYVSRSLLPSLDPPFIDLHAATWTGPHEYELAPDARRFENWECFVAGRLGLARAAQYALDLGLDAIEARTTLLGARLRERLSAIPGVKVCDAGAEKCGIVTFQKEDEPAHDLAARLRRRGANTSVSPASYARLDFAERGLGALVRASVHYYNTESEIERFCALAQASE